MGVEETRVVEDGRALAREGARIFAAAAGTAVRARGRFSVAVPGGETPRGLFRVLASSFRDDLPWGAIHLFWTDERAVPPEHGRSNYRVALEEMITKVALPAANVHRIHGDLPTGKAAMEYEAELVRHFGGEEPPRFDLVMLGVGEDGHTASLFPGSRALAERSDLAVATSPPGVPGDGRVTLTLPVLEGARAVVFLAAGKAKAQAVRRILSGGAGRLDSPAGALRPREGRLLWLLDREAASLLPAARR